MKKIFLILTVISLSSCSNMSADAQKVCELIPEIIENTTELMKIDTSVAFGDVDEEAKFKELQNELEEIGEQVEAIISKYDRNEFVFFLLENCEAAKELKELGMGFDQVWGLEVIDDLE